MKHFSHPHDLKLSEPPSLLPKKEDYDNENDEIICSVCEQKISSDDNASYTCPKTDCQFILHKSCFELPKEFQHKSHPNHSLTLLSEPPPYSLYYSCDACGDLINSFSFHCDECNYKIHVKCAFLPEIVECKAHKHDLALTYTESKLNVDGYTFFMCDVCEEGVTEGYWTYYCKECNFATHLDCAASAEAPKEEEEKEEEGDDVNGEEEEEGSEEESDAVKLAKANIRAMDQMARLQFQMQMAELNARITAMLFRSYY